MSRPSSSLLPTVAFAMVTLCAGVRLNKLADKMAKPLCPEVANFNTKGDCVDANKEPLAPKCCQCSAQIKDAMRSMGERTNLYMIECGVQQNDLSPMGPEGTSVLDNTRICAKKCQDVEALKKPLDAVVEESCNDDLAQTQHQHVEIMSKVLKVLDAAWEDCSTTSTSTITSTTTRTTTMTTTTSTITSTTTSTTTTITTTSTITSTITSTTTTTMTTTSTITSTTSTSTTTSTTRTTTRTSTTTTKLTTTTVTTVVTSTITTTTTGTELFGPITEDELNTVFLIDNSGSMKEPLCRDYELTWKCQVSLDNTCRDYKLVKECKDASRLDFVKSELTSVIDGLGSNHMFTVAAFSHTLGQFTSEMVPATRSNKAKAAAWIRDLKPYGGTLLKGALSAILKTKTKIDAIHLLSDGLPSDCSEVKCMPMSGTVGWTEYSRRRYQMTKHTLTQKPIIHTTLFMPGEDLTYAAKPRSLLMGIANHTGGNFREPYPPTPVRNPPAKPQCPDSARSQFPDKYGDCNCPQYKECFMEGHDGWYYCPHPTKDRGRLAKYYFPHTCETCACFRP